MHHHEHRSSRPLRLKVVSTMGANLTSCLHSNSEREVKSASSNDSAHESNNSTKGSSIIKLLKPECWKTQKVMKKRQSPHQPDHKSMITKVGKLTLEDLLIMASPGRADRFSGGHELYVFSPANYKRVHPSSSTGSVDTALSSKAKDSFCLKRSRVLHMSTGKAAEGESESSLIISTNQSGKLKKKVRFRLPEEGDIIVFQSPESHDDREYCS
ncbi:uncharacterized protein LOC121265560 [Juglans microcarpa x Juglans regia]|uniref:uncharacterized protein LOC121265560 n=1 Tax=Juglans microcarpa x Juglans regia TaxID=2249226 RepID=UPI001B7DC094|nr:uncharacterized protein LOC121265560 [Juglans microcarpa x Juglans regia]